MQATRITIPRSPLEEARFGVRAARVVDLREDVITAIMEQCRKDAIEFLVARVPVQDTRTAQALEREGFLLMDTLVYYSRDLRGTPIPAPGAGVGIRPLEPGEEARVRAVAAGAFKDYSGHYHADPRLDPVKCDESYIEWAESACARQGAGNEVLVAERDDSVCGFIALRMNSTQEGECALIAVDPSVQGLGIGRSLMIGAMEWCARQGAERMIISTQLNNISSQKVWVRLGFEPACSYYTFHRWFDAL